MSERDYKVLMNQLANAIDVVDLLSDRLSERQRLAVWHSGREHLDRKIAQVEMRIDEQLRAEVQTTLRAAVTDAPNPEK